MKNSIMEVNINAFESNINKIKEMISPIKEIMPVFKANAYGTYLNKKLDILNEFNIIGVANVYEAEEIRKIGYKKDILILIQPSFSDLEKIIETNSIVGLSSKEFLDEVIKKNLKIRAHLEIETGMGRTGIYLDELENFISEINSKNIEVEGVYTHFASADSDLEFTKKQIIDFKKASDIVKEKFKIKYVHCQASSGILNTKIDFCNLVRPGILMYGYEPYKDAFNKSKFLEFKDGNFLVKFRNEINFEKVIKLKSKINFIKTIKKGESIGYGRKFVAEKETRVATVLIGYADGIRRSFLGSNVVINGKKAKIIGAICMDSLMIDVSETENVKVGSEVYIFDNENIRLEDLASKAETINYEILSTISDRVERIFK